MEIIIAVLILICICSVYFSVRVLIHLDRLHKYTKSIGLSEFETQHRIEEVLDMKKKINNLSKKMRMLERMIRKEIEINKN